MKAKATQLAKIEAAAAAARLAETLQVLKQPHRHGSNNPLRESALGRFVDDHRLGVELYNAAEEYRVLVYRWRMAAGVQVPKWVREEFRGSGNGVDEDRCAENIAEWKSEIRHCETALKCAGLPPFHAAQSMIFDDITPVLWFVAPLRRALMRLAIERGKFSF